MCLRWNSRSTYYEFGLYGVGPSRDQRLLSRRGQSIGDKSRNSRRKVPWKRVALRERCSCQPTRSADWRRKASRQLQNADAGRNRASNCPWWAEAPANYLLADPVLAQLEAANRLHAPYSIGFVGHPFRTRAFSGTSASGVFRHDLPCQSQAVTHFLPIWKELQSKGIQRYGFHGLSCKSIVDRVAESGIPTVRDRPSRQWCKRDRGSAGKSIDTSMGLTPTGGVIMGGRIMDSELAYLLRAKKFDATMLKEFVDHLVPACWRYSSVGQRHPAVRRPAPSECRCIRFPVRCSCSSISKQVAAIMAALGGIDLLVFTGGIGENDVEARAAICGGLSWLGVSLNPARNRSGENPVSEPASPCAVHVLPSAGGPADCRHYLGILATKSLPGIAVGKAVGDCC